MERRAIVVVERFESGGLEPSRELAQLGQPLGAGCGRVTIWRLRSFGSRRRSTRPCSSIPVENPDQHAAVEAERVGDSCLCLARALRKQGEHAVGVRIGPGPLERVHRLDLGGVAEAREQEEPARQELVRDAGRARQRRRLVFRVEHGISVARDRSLLCIVYSVND